VKRTLLQSLAVFSLLLSIPVRSQAEPYSAGGFQGRIALSHDGNFNDEDDWGAFPVAIAILDAFGVKDKLVHIEYNNIIQANDDRSATIHHARREHRRLRGLGAGAGNRARLQMTKERKERHEALRPDIVGSVSNSRADLG
jgi:hypothetical protein